MLVNASADPAGAEVAAPAAIAADATVTTGYSQSDYNNLKWVAQCKGKTPERFSKEATAIIAYLVYLSRPSEARKLRPLPVIDGPIKVAVRWSGERIPGVDGIGRFFSLDRRQSQRVSTNLFVYLGLLECGRPPLPKPPPPNCVAGYSPCIPPGSDVDCAGGSGNGPRYVSGPIRVAGSDPYGLDHDGDGIACENG